MRAWWILCLAWFLFVGSNRAPAATYEVAQRDPEASDDGPGTVEKPWRTLGKAAERAGPGDTVLIAGGVYREEVVIKTNGMAGKPVRFEAVPGAQVVLTGADQLTRWRRADGVKPIFSIAWPYRFIPWSTNMTHPDDVYHRLIGRCEQVAVDGYLLHQVLERDQLSPGSFFADIPNRQLLVWDAGGRGMNTVFVEGSTREQILRVEGDYVEVRGLHFRLAANAAQQPAVLLTGAHDLLEDCDVEAMNACGAGFAGPRETVRRCVFRDNGQLGFGASHAHGLLFTECLVENNNTKGFDRSWEAGGDKLVLCRDAVLERSQFVRNRGNGIWFDIGDEHCTVRQCLIADNEDGGLFDEISFGLEAHDNVIVGNGFADTAGTWGARAGITLSSSPDSVIERNLLVGNREGFDFRDQLRTTRRIDDPQPVSVSDHDELIRRNLLVLNRDAQLWGWFDLPDERNWPSSPTNRPGALTLKDLRLRLEDNIYFAGNGQGFLEWGPAWRRHQSYRSVAGFQADLNIDHGGRVVTPVFANAFARDFRVDRPTMKELAPNYPQGPVPGCSLGVIP